jgi:hypothetical protein
VYLVGAGGAAAGSAAGSGRAPGGQLSVDPPRLHRLHARSGRIPRARSFPLLCLKRCWQQNAGLAVQLPEETRAPSVTRPSGTFVLSRDGRMADELTFVVHRSPPRLS